MTKDFPRGEPGAPKIVDRSTFQVELDALRIREKAHTREGDATAAARRRLPMVEIAPRRSSANMGRFHCWMCLRDAGCSSPTTSSGIPAAVRRSSARGALYIHRKSASCPSYILVTSRIPHSAKDHTKRAPGTATSWAGRCLGTRPLAATAAERRAPLPYRWTSHPPVVSPEGRVFGRPGNQQALNGAVIFWTFRHPREEVGVDRSMAWLRR
jgi:hypothetical protein